MAKKIKVDLSQFKASGVYTLEFDASENVILTSQTIRLVIGFSNKGPFNTPVYIPDFKTALAVYGDIDKTLENQGSYFHRSIQACLNTGPVFALNLLKLNNDETSSTADIVGYKSFSVDTEEQNGILTDKLYASFFNKERFWFADPDYFLATLSVADSGRLFNLVNLGKESTSVITRKSTDAVKPILGYNIFAIDWYGADNVPNYVHPYDYMEDYFIDVISVSGDWTDYSTLSLDPKWSNYFTANGFIKSQIDNFLADSDVNIVTSVTGSILPGFVDLGGNSQYIQTIINNNTVTTGIFCAIDEKGIEDICNNSSRIDLVGHHLIDELTADGDLVTPRLNFLSYDQALLADYPYDQNLSTVTGTGNGLNVGTLFIATGATGATSGMLETEFVPYSELVYDGGYHYLETLPAGASGAATAEELTLLKTFLSVNDNDDQKFIIGDVISLVGSDAIIDQFTENDLIKLKVLSVKEINGALRIIYSHPLDTPAYRNLGIEIEPTYDGTVSGPISGLSNAYQFGHGDLLERADVVTPTGATGGALTDPNTPIAQTLIAYSLSDFYADAKKEEIQDGDSIWGVSTGPSQWLTFTSSVDRDQFSLTYCRAYANISRYDGTPVAAGLDGTSQQTDIEDWDTTYASNNAGSPVDTNTTINIVSAEGAISEIIDVVTKIDSTSFTISTLDSSISVGDWLVSTDKDICTDTSENLQSRLTRVLSVAQTLDQWIVKVTTSRPIEYSSSQTAMTVRKFRPIEEFTNSFQFTYLSGFTMRATHRPNGSDARVTEILDVLYNTNLASTLATKDVISFRYIVDTFAGQILPNSKFQLSKLAKDRQKALALINAPSMDQFRISTDPRFTDAPTNVDPYPSLETRYIAEGGNLSLNPSYTFSLPTEDQGSKFCGFFMPYLVLRENNKNIKVPPAAFISNNFVRKFSNGEPYAIIAGQKRGVISGNSIVGLEYDFDDDDRGNLEPVGLNPIIKKRGLGPVIFGNQTAYQQVNSAFNLIHVRDILISVENDVEEILANYLFDFNEDSIRLEIKTLVDNYLDGVRAGGGIYAYQTIMDSSNNTPAIIDMNMGIIDIIIEPARGIQKFINRITVTKTGGIAAGGFINFV